MAKLDLHAWTSTSFPPPSACVCSIKRPQFRLTRERESKCAKIFKAEVALPPLLLPVVVVGGLVNCGCQLPLLVTKALKGS